MLPWRSVFRNVSRQSQLKELSALVRLGRPQSRENQPLGKYQGLIVDITNSQGESGWCSGVTSTHGAWRHAGVRFLLPGVFGVVKFKSFAVFIANTLTDSVGIRTPMSNLKRPANTQNDSEGIRTPAGRAQWISSPSP